MKWLGLLVLVGCVADVPGGKLPPPNPIPPSDPAEDEEPAGSQTQVTATGYLTEIATIHCEQAFGCRATYPNDAATFEASWTTSAPECVAMLHEAWATGSIESEIAKGRIDFDGMAAVDCLGGIAFPACDMYWTTGIQWAESCYSVMTGNVAIGDSCDSRYACESYDCDLTTRRCI